MLAAHHSVMDEIKALVTRHERRVRAVVPEGETSVSGSTLLGHYGGHDLDLVVLVPDVADAADRLRSAYPPLYAHETRDGGRRAPSTRVWELILADEALRAEYERLKAAGMDSAQKKVFFERVVAMLDEP